MPSINWILYSEAVRGANAPGGAADVSNRPLREVLTLSGLDPDANFPGFAANPVTALINANPGVGGSFEFDLQQYQIVLFTIINGNDFNIINPVNGVEGQTLRLIYTSLAGGAVGTVTWGSKFRFVGGVVPVWPAHNKQRMIEWAYSATFDIWVEKFRSSADMDRT